MLTRLVLELCPPTWGNPSLPVQASLAVSAAILAAIRDRVLPDVSAVLHDSAAPKRFAVTPLLDRKGDVLVGGRPSSAVLEVGVLRDDLAPAIVAAPAVGLRIRIGHSHWDVRGVEVTFCASYGHLLATARPATGWAFELVTPVSFATGRGDGARRQRVLPDPERVFGALATRWRALSDGVPKPVRAALLALATFALVGEVGDRTSVGMGYARPGRITPLAPDPERRRVVRQVRV